MTIEPGQEIPSIPVRLIDASGTSETTSDVVLGRGRVVFFAVPGAFTPTCHVNHLPGFIEMQFEIGKNHHSATGGDDP